MIAEETLQSCGCRYVWAVSASKAFGAQRQCLLQVVLLLPASSLKNGQKSEEECRLEAQSHDRQAALCRLHYVPHLLGSTFLGL